MPDPPASTPAESRGEAVHSSGSGVTRNAGSDPSEALRIAYEQTCQSYHAVADFRGKLLALLPLASGTGVFLLLSNDGASGLLGPIGLFGMVVTLGLLIFELRGIQRCHGLEKLAETLEKAMKLREAERGVLHLPARSLSDMLGPPAAALVVYLAVIAAWLFVAGVGMGWWEPAKGKGNGAWVLAVGYVGALTLGLFAVHRWLHPRMSRDQGDTPVSR